MTKIAWTDTTWNIVTGCTKVSEGCRHCYAERLTLQHNLKAKPWTAQNASEVIRLHPDRLANVRVWKTPRRIFVCSMADLFHDLVSDTFLGLAFDVMAENSQHVFQVLTKRPARAVAWSFWPDNVWCGTSVEDARAKHRIAVLRECRAKTKFVSFEPLIGPVENVDLTGFAWAICGGESGPEHRPMDMAWARYLRDTCRAQGLAFFFKQDSAVRPGIRPYLVEADGSETTIQEYPNEPAAEPMMEQMTLL